MNFIKLLTITFLCYLFSVWRKRRVFRNPKIQQCIVDEFHKIYHAKESSTWRNTYWLGTSILKTPQDMMMYQEILYETKPDIIIETGTAHGGSALYFASLQSLLRKGKTVSIDTKFDPSRPAHKRITYITGSSISRTTVNRLKRLIKKQDRVMVILDSDHHEKHVLEELRIYSKLVTKGCYLVVEDTHLDGNPVDREFFKDKGPAGALNTFLKEQSEFIVDKNKERLLLTFFPGGFLKKI